MCKQVRKGLKSQMEVDDAIELDACETDDHEICDSVTGESFDPKLVRIAREEEIEFYRNMKVSKKVTRAVAFGKTGKSPIKVMWVDHNKGTTERPEIRSSVQKSAENACESP